jgi:hypothetical protein
MQCKKLSVGSTHIIFAVLFTCPSERLDYDFISQGDCVYGGGGVNGYHRRSKLRVGGCGL